MTTFLTVKAAAIFSNRSPSSVRRIIYPILEDNRHPDRHHIEPDVATAKSLRVKGENFAWKVSEELLRRVMAEEGTKSTTESRPASKNAPDQSAAILEIFADFNKVGAPCSAPVPARRARDPRRGLRSESRTSGAGRYLPRAASLRRLF